MQSGKLSPLMEQLEAWFDWIVIDSPPVLPLADTSLWSRLADGILLVTRKGTTEKQQLQRGLEAIEKSKLLGALVNSSANAAHSDYYQRYSSSLPIQPKAIKTNKLQPAVPCVSVANLPRKFPSSQQASGPLSQASRSAEDIVQARRSGSNGVTLSALSEAVIQRRTRCPKPGSLSANDCAGKKEKRAFAKAVHTFAPRYGRPPIG